MKKRLLSLLLAGIIVFTNAQVFASEVDTEQPVVEEEVTEDTEEKEEVTETEEETTEEKTEENEEKTEKYNVMRIAGANRYETAMKASEAIMSAEIAVLASGQNFADALFGGPLAAQVSGPILLTAKDELPKGMEDTLKELGTKMIYLLGGTSSVSEKVEDELKEMGYTVTRIAGKDRVETASLISNTTANLRGVKVLGDLPSIVVSGTNFADALSAAPYADLLFTTSGYARFIPYNDYMKDNDTVIGGTSSVPTGIEKERIAGKDRYETAIKVAEAQKALLKEKKNYDLKTVIVVDGTNYPDALAAGPVASSKNAAILLTSPNKLNEGVAKFIKDNEIENVYIFGGASSVSEEVEKAIEELR